MPSPEASPAPSPEPPATGADEPAPAAGAADENSQRTDLNLLGQVDASGGESRRNENVRITLIDNNVLKELNIRLGATATVIEEFSVENAYYGSEYGNSPRTQRHLSSSGASGFHGSFYETHNNSVFTARSFFQAGEVKPARENDYGLSIGIPLRQGSRLQIDAAQQKLRGNVNGNILVPTRDERTPLTTDPLRREFVERILNAFPDELPNRTERTPRALNTNATQNIDNNNLGGLWEQDLGRRDRLVARYRFTTQKVDAFQLVGGQNPNTTTRSHDARLTWNRAWSPATITDISAGFDRIASILVPDESFPGVGVSVSSSFERVGVTTSIPIDRAQNQFRYAGRLLHTKSRHSLTSGFELLRRQVNGFESNSHLGFFIFRNDFGNTAVENFLRGTASEYIQSVGNVHRGYRNWEMQYFLGDTWRVSPDLTLSIGLRYQPWTRPVEVHGLDKIPYGCDCNNVAPQFGLAYRLHDGWGVLRAAYGIHYGDILPVTYGQTRFNAPGNLRITVQTPDLINPLGDLDPENFDPATPATLFDLDPELASPYTHHYNFTWELPFISQSTLRFGYVGSRTHKIIALWNLNRGRRMEGIPHTTGTVNQRRPELSILDIRRFLNGSRGYYDAAKVTLSVPRWGGWTMDASYWFSKAIDLGASYTSTGTGRDGFDSRGQTEFDVHGDMRGLSRFDQPHAFLSRMTYEMPSLSRRGRWAKTIFGQWQLSAVVLVKSGTPFSLRSGSDSPGFGNVDGASSDRPNVIDPSVLGRTIGHPDTSQDLLPAEAFGFLQPGQERGNIGKHTFRKDGIANVNAALSHDWPLRGEMALHLRAESLNFFNTPQFAEPGRALTASDFGIISNTLNDGRTFRFMLRLAF